MITTRTHHLQPTTNHPSRKVTIINVVNYDKFQYGDNEQPPYDHLSQQGLKNKSTKNQITNSSNKNVNKSSKEYEEIGIEGHYRIILKDNKKYLKHKWKDEPLKDY